MAEKRHKLTTAEAVKMVKSAPAGSKFAAIISADAAIEGDDDHVFRGACSSYVNLSRKDAVRLAGNMLSETMEARGGRLVIRVAVSEYRSDEGKATYWIG